MITSRQNEIVRQIIALRARKNREAEGRLIVEGEKFACEINESRHVEYYAVSESFAQRVDLAPLSSRAKVHVLSDALFAYASDTDNPQGILACVAEKSFALNELPLTARPFFVVLDGLNDPGNLGAIIRTAAAADADAVILSEGSCDHCNPKAVRASAGAVFRLPIVKNAASSDIIGFLRGRGVKIIAADISGEKTPYEADMTEGIAVVVGNEANGASERLIAAAGEIVRLPMPGRTESINAAVAAGIVIYEAVRQRGL